MDHEHIPQQVLYWDIPGQTRTNWRDVVKMDHEHIPQQVLYWDVPGQTRTNWRDVVKKDLQHIPQQVLYWDVPGQTRTNWRDVVKRDHDHIPVPVAFYCACSDEIVHYKSDETVNFCGFRCATTSPITVFINFVFLQTGET